MRHSCLLVILLLSASSIAQKRQPNAPSEPALAQTPASEAAEEKFPPEAGVVPPSKPPAPKSPFEGMKYRLVGPYRGGRVLAVGGGPGQPDTYYFGRLAA